MEKTCTKCGLTKNESEFVWKNKAKGKRTAQCKDCTRANIREHYRNNKKYYIQKGANNILRVRKKIFEYLQNHSCVDCGESDPVVLEFDHVRGNKKGCISRMISDGCGWENIQKEIDKCEVRCANCHRRKTAKTLGYYLYAGIV